MNKLRNLLLLSFTTLFFTGCVKDRVLPDESRPIGPIDPGSRQLIHYWNFNTPAPFSALIAPTFTIGDASLEYTAAWDEVGEGSRLNARNNDLEGSALRLRNPAGDFFINIPTTGHRDILLTFAVMRTGSGAQENRISYSTDGVTFQSTGFSPNIISISEDFVLHSFDFSAIAAANNNPNFRVRIQFALGNTNATGNNRYDNITVDANPIGGGGGGGTDPVELDILHYWNFNDIENIEAPTVTTGGASIFFNGLTTDAVLTGTTLNAQNNDPAGAALRMRSPKEFITFVMPTINHNNIQLSFAIARNPIGPQAFSVSYTANGSDFITQGLSLENLAITESYELIIVNFSEIPEVNNNNDFAVRLTFSNGNETAGGQTRIDNLVLKGSNQ
ncbi:MAG: hypothetical protein ACXITV_09900 [Luteibaculaceae bacterium]